MKLMKRAIKKKVATMKSAKLKKSLTTCTTVREQQKKMRERVLKYLENLSVLSGNF